MTQQRIFALLTFLFFGAAVSIVVVEKIYDGDWNAVFENGGVPPSLANTEKLQDEVQAEQADESRIELVSANQVQEQIASFPQLAHIPWSTAEIDLAFKAAAGHSCRLLPPNVFVTPLAPEGGEEGQLKRLRMTALTIGLQVDPSRRRELPLTSKKIIEDYLANHVLAIQPTLIQDAAGETFFDGTVQAAFYPVASPTITVAAEPMIAEAVGSFRVLGMYDGSVLGSPPGKTLVMAFRYFREQQVGTISLEPIADYDLFFLHQDDVDGQSRMIAFATVDGRSRFEELDLSLSAFAGVTTVTASVYFKNYTMMGQYPANPIVLGVKNRSLASLPADEFIRKVNGDETNPPIPLPKLLRSFHDNPPPIVGALPFP